MTKKNLSALTKQFAIIPIFFISTAIFFLNPAQLEAVTVAIRWTPGVTATYANPTITSTSSIKATDTLELRQDIDNKAAACGMTGSMVWNGWTSANLTAGGTIRGRYIQDMRDNLKRFWNPVFTAPFVRLPPAPSFTDDPITAGVSTIRAAHITEIRNAFANARCCGDLTCDAGDGETLITCPVDCGGTFTCPGLGCESALGENCSNCPADCGACTFTCGLNGCESGLGETCSNCPADCGACPTCGDAWIDPGEQCDYGAALHGPCPAACSVTCTNNNCCGNGVIDGIPGLEQCDTGASRGSCPATCSLTCTNNSCPVCGNGIQEGTEQCDTGASLGSCPATCSIACTLNACSCLPVNSSCSGLSDTSCCSPYTCNYFYFGSRCNQDWSGETCSQTCTHTSPLPNSSCQASTTGCLVAYDTASDCPQTCCCSYTCAQFCLNQGFSGGSSGCSIGGSCSSGTKLGPPRGDCGSFNCPSSDCSPLGEACCCQGPLCGTVGTPCTTDGQCCSGMCPASNLCAASCLAAGSPGCNSNPDCCAGSTCVGGVCQTCGNGIREGAEQCDTGAARGSCPATCSLSCTNNICAFCGNGVIEGSEQCDSGNLGGQTCATRGYTGGSLSCTGSCTFNTSACTLCGNGIREGSEACDTGAARGSCPATCSFSCTNNSCAFCGNGIREGAEACDTGAARGSCPATCSLSCTLNSCPFCGNGIREGTEQCDNGVSNSDTVRNACRTNCRNPWCGDRVCDAPSELSPWCSADCLACLRDADSDGVGQGSTFVADSRTGCPVGWGQVPPGDCCDTDNRVKPGTTSYWLIPNNCGNFDYNCSGSPERYPLAGNNGTYMGDCKAASDAACSNLCPGTCQTMNGTWNSVFSVYDFGWHWAFPLPGCGGSSKLFIPNAFYTGSNFTGGGATWNACFACNSNTPTSVYCR